MPASDTPRHLAVLAGLRMDCLSGAAYAGRLPSEPELARRHGVSRATIRRAIAALIAEGVLEARHGAGTFIRPGSDRARTIGLLVSETVAKNPDDPYAQQLVNHLVLTLAANGWSLRLARSAEEMRQGLAVERGAVVSACVAAFYGDADLAPLRGMPVPLVLLDSELHPGLPCVLADNAAGVRQAVARLVALGHSDIAHIAGGSWALSGCERRDAFIAAMADAGLPLHEDRIRPGSFDIASGHAGMAALAAAGRLPTAVLCGNDLMAVGAMRWLAEHGHAIGRDVSVVGCDDIAIAGLMSPALATIALDFAAHAQAVLDAVVDVHRPEVRRTRMRLVERASLGPAPR